MLPKSKSLLTKIVHLLPSSMALILFVVIALSVMSTRSTSVAAATLPENGSPSQTNPAHTTEALLPPAFTVIKRDALLVDNDSDSQADPGDTIAYTVVITNTGPDPATGVVFTDTIDTSTTLIAASVETTPLARNDSYTALGNVRISHAAGNGVLTNDNDPDGGTVTITSSDAVSAQGGVVAVNLDGSFSYNPPAGYEGTDTFTYTITDDEGDTDTGIVTITVSGMIWFINTNPAACSSGCDGRLTTPFTTLADFQAVNDGTGNNPAANDNIFLYESATNYTGPVTLLNGQRLIGQDATSSLAALTGLTPPPGSDPLPAMNSANGIFATITSAGTGVTLGQNNRLHGFTAGNATGTAITGTNFGTLAVSDVTINTTGFALNLSTGTFGTPATFTSITSTGGTNNVNLNAVGGTGNLGTGALSGATSHAFVMTGGTGTISYSGTINNTTARVVSIIGKTGGTVTLSGTVTGTNQGVFLDANNGATINFTGGNMNLNTGTNAAFTATGGGTVNVTGAGNILNTTTATALNVTNTTIGASNLNFQRISSNGGSSTGIILNTTGTTGGLNVTGTGAAASGGTIANKTGADGSVTTGIGIYLNSTSNVSLAWMQMNGFSNFAIRGLNVTGFSLSNSVISGTSGDNGGADEGAIIFGTFGSAIVNGLVGTGSITNSDISGGVEDNVRIRNFTGTLTQFTVSGSAIHDTPAVSPGNNGLLVQADGTANMTVDIINTNFTRNRANGIQAITNDNGVIDIEVGTAAANSGGTYQDNNIGVNIAHNSTGTLNFDVRNGTFQPVALTTGASPININLGFAGNQMSGTVTNNFIRNANSPTGPGIRIISNGAGTLTIAASNNNIAQIGNRGIEIIARDGSNRINATVNNNTIALTDPLSADGIRADAGAVSTDTTTICANITGNTSTTVAGVFGVRVRQRFAGTTYFLQGYGGSATDDTAVANFLSANNGGATALADHAGTGFQNGVCPTPAFAPEPPILLDDASPTDIEQEQDLRPQELEPIESSMPNPSTGLPARERLSRVAVPNSAVPETELPVTRNAAPMLSGENINIVIGVLPPGKSITVRFNVTVDNPFPAGDSQVCNQSTILSNELPPVVSNDPDTAPVNDPTCTPVDAAPDLRIVKSDGGITSVPGGVIAYTLTYSNTGNQHASGVTIVDTVPVGTTFNPGASTAGWACVPDNNAGSVCTLNVGNVNVGAAATTATFAVTVINPVPAGLDAVSNTATIDDDGTGGTDPTPANNSSTDTTPINANPDLTINKDDGGATGTPGGVVAYTLTYTNTGNQGAANVTLTDTVPANSTFNPGASTAGWACVPDNNAGSVCTLNVGTVNGGNAGGTAIFAVTIINPVPAGVTQISNTASVADDGANGADPTPANNSDTDTTPINAAPDMSITKSDGGATTTPGGTVAYTLNYANNGNQGATGVTLSETVPANSTFNAGASTAGWVCVPDNNAGSTCTLTIGAVAGGGGSGSATFAVTVVNPVPAGVTQISNTATVADDGANGADPTPANNSGSDTTPVTATPDLSISKNDGGATGTPGGVVAYTLTYTNTGNQGATGVTLTDVVPANTVFNPGASTAGWACAPDNNAGSTCTLAIGTVAGGGATGSATFAVTVVNPVPAGVTQISNTASVADDGANGADPTPGNNSDTDTTPINATPDLTITKDDGGITAEPGDPITYTLNYANVGNQNATGVTITDIVPANTTFNPAASTAGWVCVPDNNAGSTCTLTIGALAGSGGSGSATFVVVVDDPYLGGPSVSNTASIADDGTNGADPNPGDNSDTDTTPIINTPDLTISKNDGGITTTPGSTIAYTLVYTNQNGQGATGVVITDTVPANTTFNPGASTAGWTCVPNNNAGSVCTLAVGAVAGFGGGSATFAVTVVNPVPAGVTQISNTTSIGDDGANGPDSDPGNNSDTDTTPVDAAPELSITKGDGGITTTPGSTVAYTLNYANNGNQGATGVTLSETVPANSTFNAGASTAGWACVPDNNAGSTCTLTIGAVAAGGSGSATFAVTVINPVPAGVTQISNTATIADDGANGADPTPANNSSTDTTPVTATPDMSITKSDGGATTTPGGTVAYTLTYINNGNQGATGVTLSETVPANSTFNVGASTAGWACVPDNNAGSVCTITIGGVAGGGGTGSVTFAVTVVNPVPSGVTQISNTATIADDGTNGADPTPANNSSTDTTPVTAAPDMTLTKDDGGVTTTPGGTVAYTLSYDNVGNQDASGVTLSDTVPANSTFNAGASTAGWACVPDNNAGSVCTIIIGAVPVTGGPASVTFAVTVNNPVPAGVTQISNTATVADDGTNGADPTPADNSDTDTTPVMATPDMSLSKDDGGVTGTPGNVVAYTLTYTNTGNQGATGVTLSDVVPANTVFNPGASTAGWACVPDNNPGSTCTLTVGAVAGGGGTGTATFAVTVNNPIPAGVTQISNTATITDDGANGADPTPGNNSDTDTTPIAAAPDLQVGKDDGGIDFLPGEVITYTIAYTNAGNQGATGVVVTDTVPANTTFNPGASSAGWVCVPDNNAGSVCTLTVGALAGGGGSGTATFAVTVDSPAPGVFLISNTACASDDGNNGPDLNPADNCGSDTTPIRNQPPVLSNVAITSPINENGTATLTGDISDADGDGFILTVDWGDGNTDVYTYTAGTASFSETHTYLDDNPTGTPSDNYTVDLTLEDTFGNSVTDSTSVTVNNVAPTLSGVNITSPINENGIATLTGTITDPGTLDTFTLTVDWGDGSATEVFTYTAGTTSFSETHTYLDDNPTATPSDNYTVSLTLNDDDTGSDTDSATVTVNNVAPTLSGVALNSPISENDVVTVTGTITDPGTLDTFTLVVDWGDGSAPETFNYPAGTTSFTETHTYLDDNPTGTPSDVNTVSLTLTDDDTGTANANPTVTVNNLPPTLSNVAATPVITETGIITLTGNIVEVGTQDTFTLTVDWADGNVETFTYPAGTTSFVETHQYLDGFIQVVPLADFPIVLTLMDDDTGSFTTSITVTVNNQAPTLSNVTFPATINEGDTATLSGNINEISPLDTFTLNVDWGDGITETFNYAAATTAFTETHTYLDDDPTATPSDTYTVTLVLTDDNGGADVMTTTITVNNVAPVLDNVAITTVDENDAAALTANLVDPGVLDTFVVVVDWGDGITETFNYGPGTTAITETHVYLDDDPTGTPSDIYTVTLSIADDDTGTGSAVSSVIVNNVAPVVNAGVDQNVPFATPVNFNGSFTDVGTLDTHEIVWDLGDGTIITGTLTPSHLYLVDGTYTVTLTVTDDDTGVGTDTMVVMVGTPTDVTLTNFEGAGQNWIWVLVAAALLPVLVWWRKRSWLIKQK